MMMSAADQMEIAEGRIFEDGALVHDANEVDGNGTVISAHQSHDVGTPTEWHSPFWYYQVRYLNGASSSCRAFCIEDGWKV